MDPGVLAGWAGGALVVARIAPQVWRSRRTGSTAGVPVAGVWAWFANDLGWLIYGISAGLTPLWLSSALLLTLDTLLLGVFPRAERLSRRAIPGLLWLALMVAAAAASPVALAAVLLAGAAAGTVPHAWEALTAKDLTGVAPLTWRLGVADGTLWLLYSVALGDLTIGVSATLTLATSLTVLRRLSRTQKPHGNPLARPAASRHRHGLESFAVRTSSSRTVARHDPGSSTRSREAGDAE